MYFHFAFEKVFLHAVDNMVVVVKGLVSFNINICYLSKEYLSREIVGFEVLSSDNVSLVRNCNFRILCLWKKKVSPTSECNNKATYFNRKCNFCLVLKMSNHIFIFE